VLFFSLDTTFEADPDDSAGGGNARLVFDEPGLEALIEKEIGGIEGFAEVSTVDVSIEEEGVIRLTLGVGNGQVGISGDLVLDPNVVDGKLDVEVVQAGLGGLGLPEPLAEIIERKLQEQLDALDPEVDYRLVSITTTNRELGLEVEL
jgi:hypothetical protein